MYQSVASSAVSTLARALELPLYTVQTSARAVIKDLAYVPTPSDEVEDLVTLLKKVKSAHPDVNAVCAGALWSDYQRLRVENAASRVGLLSLAYLWRRDQKELLDEMITTGLDAVLVKVAGVGLKESHLGKSLKEMRQTLLRLDEKYGSHVCGEGGEFETFLLWMPGMKKRVVLDEVRPVHHSDDPVAPVIYLDILSCHLEDPTEEQISLPIVPKPPVPSVFREKSNHVSVQTLSENFRKMSIPKPERISNDISIGVSKDFLHIVVRSVQKENGLHPVTTALNMLKNSLRDNGQSLGGVIYVLLHLRDVSGLKYAEANSRYTEIFGIPECVPPPSRACVGIDVSNHNVILEALVRKRRNRSLLDSRTLHVQSLSEWAPPCIGPYAQFNEEEGVIHISGVLPLYAPLATIPSHLDIDSQVEACAYNFSRTLEASRSSMDKLGLFVAYVTAPSLVEAVSKKLKRTFLHSKSTSLIVPVSELPKGGKLEIRATGTLDKESLYRPIQDKPSQNSITGHVLQCDAVCCGKFGYFSAIIPKSSRIEAAKFPVSLRNVISTYHSFEQSRPLSAQVYVGDNIGFEFDVDLQKTFSGTGVCVIRSSWMPDDAKFIGLFTFAL